MTRVAVLGAGSWGTALALHLASTGRGVSLWARRPELAAALARERENRAYLPGFALPELVAPTSDLGEALEGCATVLSVVPSQHTREVVTAAAPHLGAARVVISATKGIELSSLARMSEVIAAAIGDAAPRGLAVVIAALSGPTFAQEVAAGHPSAAVVACAEESCAASVQELFSSPRLRLYRSTDLAGVECAGAFKNVIAIACGIVDGLGFGANTRAALITRGLREMARLGVALGGDERTFAGLAGMGDLILTATGDLSRNRQVGLRIGRGETLDAITADMRMVAEGVRTCSAAAELARRHGVDMPIVAAVEQVLHRGKDPREALRELMTRELKSEVNAP